VLYIIRCYLLQKIHTVLHRFVMLLLHSGCLAISQLVLYPDQPDRSDLALCCVSAGNIAANKTQSGSPLHTMAGLKLALVLLLTVAVAFAASAGTDTQVSWLRSCWGCGDAAACTRIYQNLCQSWDVGSGHPLILPGAQMHLNFLRCFLMWAFLQQRVRGWGSAQPNSPANRA
jgi:hypothetical protein